MLSTDVPVQVRETQQKTIFDGIKNASLIAHAAKGELLPWIIEHQYEIGCGIRQSLDFFQSFFTLKSKSENKQNQISANLFLSCFSLLNSPINSFTQDQKMISRPYRFV